MWRSERSRMKATLLLGSMVCWRRKEEHTSESSHLGPNDGITSIHISPGFFEPKWSPTHISYSALLYMSHYYVYVWGIVLLTPSGLFASKDLEAHYILGEYGGALVHNSEAKPFYAVEANSVGLLPKLSLYHIQRLNLRFSWWTSFFLTCSFFPLSDSFFQHPLFFV